MDSPQYVDADVPSDVVFSCMFYYTYHRDMYVLKYVTPLKKKKESNFTILKRNIKHYELQVTNPLHQYYITRLNDLDHIPSSTKNVVDYSVLAKHVCNTPLPVTKH
jgi:hypothetical protein